MTDIKKAGPHTTIPEVSKQQATAPIATRASAPAITTREFTTIETLKTAQTQTRAATDQARAATEQVRLGAKSQMVDRFTKAVEQLGARDNGRPRIETQLGAIYALEKLSEEDDEYYWPVMKILAGYIRVNAEFETTKRKYNIDDDAWERTCRFKYPEPGENIETAMKVLAGRKHISEDLHQALNLQGADLRQLWLENRWLHMTYLRGAHLDHSYLRGTSFYSAALSSASLECADLEDADLRWVYFKNTLMRGAKLSGANVCAAHFEQVVGLTPRQIQTALHWRKAFYSGDMLKELGFPNNHNERLQHEIDASYKHCGGCWSEAPVARQ